MKRSLVTAFGGTVLVGSLLTGCAAIDAAKDVKDAAKGLANAGKDAEQFQAKLERSKTLTFSATYSIKKPGSPEESYRIAQKPPKSAYKQGDTQIIDDGSKIYICSRTDGKDQCIESGSHTDAGLYGVAGFGFAFNPASFTGLYLAAALVPGVNASKGSRSIGGLPSDCTALEFTEGTDKGKRFEGCTSADGILTYSLDTTGSEVTLTTYDTSVTESAFTLPAKGRSIEDLTREATSTTSTLEATTSTSLSQETTTSSVP